MALQESGLREFCALRAAQSLLTQAEDDADHELNPAETQKVMEPMVDLAELQEYENVGSSLQMTALDTFDANENGKTSFMEFCKLLRAFKAFEHADADNSVLLRERERERAERRSA